MKLNFEAIKSIAHTNPTSEGVFLSLSERERFRSSSNLVYFKRELMEKGVKLVEADYIKVFKDLEKENVGELVYGRRGNPDKFRWFYNLKDIARMGLEGKDFTPQSLTKKKSKPAAKTVEAPVVAKAIKQRVSKKSDNSSYIQILIPRDMLKYIKTTDAA